VESAIDEEDAERENALIDAQLDAEARSEASLTHIRRVSGLSGISGTTAKTSFSQEEAEQLDSDIIIDVLPTLASASDKLAELLLPAGVATLPETWKEIRTPGSRHNKLYNIRMNTINVLKPNFGSQEYIQPKIVLRVLFGADALSDVPNSPWRHNSIIHKINLTQMINNILVTCDPSDLPESALNVLERLDVAFPGAVAGGNYSSHTLNFWLKFAAQLIIARLEAAIESDPSLDPIALIDGVFDNEDGSFRHDESLGLHSIENEELELALAEVDDFQARLRQPFENGDTALAIDALRAEHTWEAFQRLAVEYYISRTAGLNDAIASVGGIDSILQNLAEVVEQNTDQKRVEQVKQTITSSGTPTKTLASKDAMKRLKQRMTMTGQQQNQAPVAQMTVNQPENDPAAGDIDDDEQPLPTAQGLVGQDAQSLAQPGREVIHEVEQEPSSDDFEQVQNRDALLLQQEAAAHRVRPRLTDPQPGARRVTNIDEDEQEEDAAQPGQSSRPRKGASQKGRLLSNANGKRRAQEMEEDDDFVPDPTQDEGFQDDTRDLAAADQRRREMSFGDAAALPLTNTAPPGSTSQSPSKRQRKNPGSSMPAPVRVPYAEEGRIPQGSYQAAKIAAKLNRVMASENKESKPRTPWDDTEENALVDLIVDNGQDGVSWSKLKSLDAGRGEGEELLWRRSAEDMRFKARNMKLTMIE
jgi:hypothetical protein